MNWYALRTLPALIRLDIARSQGFWTTHFQVSTKSWELHIDPLLTFANGSFTAM
jgi:hypothetical protein